MEVVGDADRVLLVTEPTPFGLHDLELAVQMARALERTPLALINRSDLGDDRVRRYLDDEGIPLLAEIPFSREVATAYAQGRIAAQACDEFRERLVPVAKHLAQEASP
jgi:MinD superfamily P-loop ATPase